MIRELVCVLVLVPALASAQGTPQRVLDEKMITERTKGFESKMQRLGFSGRVQSCNHMMLVAVGVRGGNMSYGAICQIAVSGKTQSVLVCDDNMMGHFGLKGGTFGMSDDSIAEFIKEDCYGGG